MARSKLSNGSEALDGKGDLLPNMTQKVEDALAELYDFLSGGVSDTTLPRALPESRGGIGNGTEASIADAVRKYGLRSFAAHKTKHRPVALCTVGYDLAPKSIALTELSRPILFTKVAKGSYRVTVPNSNIVLDANYVFIRPDNHGNQRCGAVVSRSNNNINITVHPLLWVAALGTHIPDTNTLVDVPSDTYMSFVLSNSLIVGD